MPNLKKAFSTLEYIILFTFIIAALLGASAYLRRAISGRWRAAADVFGHGRQYYPGITKCYDLNGNEIECELGGNLKP